MHIKQGLFISSHLQSKFFKECSNMKCTYFQIALHYVGILHQELVSSICYWEQRSINVIRWINSKNNGVKIRYDFHAFILCNMLFSIIYVKKNLQLGAPEEIIIPNLKATALFTICCCTKVYRTETQNHLITHTLL